MAINWATVHTGGSLVWRFQKTISSYVPTRARAVGKCDGDPRNKEHSRSRSRRSRGCWASRAVLTSGGFRFVVSAATYTELQELRAKSRFGTASRDHWTSTMADIGTHHN